MKADLDFADDVTTIAVLGGRTVVARLGTSDEPVPADCQALARVAVALVAALLPAERAAAVAVLGRRIVVARFGRIHQAVATRRAVELGAAAADVHAPGATRTILEIV